MGRSSCAGPILAGLLLAAGPAAAADAPAPESILQATLDGAETPYQGRMMVTHWYGKQARADEVEVYFSPPNRYRWEFLNPDGSLARVAVSDGEQEQVYLPQRRKVLRGSAIKSADKRMSLDEEQATLLRNYVIVFSGADFVAGRPAWVLELSPKVQGKPSQRLWVDQETYAILEIRRFRRKGQFATLSRFTRFTPKKELPEDLFQLSVDSGTRMDEHGLDPEFLSLEEFERAVGRAAGVPKELPGGFVFESAALFRIKSQEVRHIRYTDGLAVLSLFETDRPVRMPKGLPNAVAPAVAPGALRLSSSGRVIHWKQGRRHYTLIGDISEELLGHASQGLAGGGQASLRQPPRTSP